MNVYPVSARPKKAETPTSRPRSETAERVLREAPTAPASEPQRREAVVLEKPPIEEPRGILLEAPTRFLTPFRLIVVAIAAVGIATAWGLWHRHRVHTAEASVLAANEAGMKALKEGDFLIAARELTRARDAVDLLHRQNSDANTIRRYCREAVAGNGLSSTSLFEILAEFTADSRQGKSRFASYHRDDWLVLDVVIANPEATNRPSVLDMPLTIDGTTFRIEVDSATIRAAALREQATGPARVIFAATMTEIRPPTSEDPNAVLVLNGKTAFLWTTLEIYTALFQSGDSAEETQLTRELLSRQLGHTEGSK